MLPLFCKIFNSVPPSVITEKFVEAVQFTQVTSNSVINDFFVKRCWSKPKQCTYIFLHQNLPGLSRLVNIVIFRLVPSSWSPRWGGARPTRAPRRRPAPSPLSWRWPSSFLYVFEVTIIFLSFLEMTIIFFYLYWRWPSSLYVLKATTIF